MLAAGLGSGGGALRLRRGASLLLRGSGRACRHACSRTCAAHPPHSRRTPARAPRAAHQLACRCQCPAPVPCGACPGVPHRCTACLPACPATLLPLHGSLTLHAAQCPHPPAAARAWPARCSAPAISCVAGQREGRAGQQGHGRMWRHRGLALQGAYVGGLGVECREGRHRLSSVGAGSRGGCCKVARRRAKVQRGPCLRGRWCDNGLMGIPGEGPDSTRMWGGEYRSKGSRKSAGAGSTGGIQRAPAEAGQQGRVGKRRPYGRMQTS